MIKKEFGIGIIGCGVIGQKRCKALGEGGKLVACADKDINRAKSLATKSNAIVFSDNQQLLGVGAGQMSRIDSVKIAIRKVEESGLNLNGAIMASDAFFPFSDSIEMAAQAGIKAIIQPGGSIKDGDIIRKADELGISMVFTGIRHFFH